MRGMIGPLPSRCANDWSTMMRRLADAGVNSFDVSALPDGLVRVDLDGGGLVLLLDGNGVGYFANSARAACYQMREIGELSLAKLFADIGAEFQLQMDRAAALAGPAFHA